MQDIDICEMPPTAVEYCELRAACGLSPRTLIAAELALPRALYTITLRSGSRLIGMGRVVGDLGCNVQICDVAVHPDFQGRKLGYRIMERIMEFIQRAAPDCAFINLFSDVDFLYEKYGFRPTKSRGLALQR